jgi:cell division septal protein FtsQ
VNRGQPRTAVVAVDRPRTLRYDQPAEQPPSRPARGQRVLSAATLTLLLGGVVAGLVWAIQSETFRIHSVQVDGASPRVRQAIEDQLAPGCVELLPNVADCPPEHLGPNVLTLSTAELEKQLIHMPLIKSARVTAQLPDQLLITVTERQPEAAWVVGSDVFRVADDGVVIDRGSPEGLKVVIGQVAGDPIKPGDTIDLNILKGAEVLQQRLPADFAIPARRIQYSPADGLAVVGDQDFVAMFGQPQDLDLKMAELQRIVQLARDKKTELAFVDLRYKTPYYRPR